MLFTRCPDCDTTFRVTDDALNKAHGQVRCGRCASVFNAYAERRDGPVEPGEPAPAAPPEAASPDTQSTPPPLPSVKIAHSAPPAPREHVQDEVRVAPSSAASHPPSNDALDSFSVADVVAQIEIGVADENAQTGELAVPLAAGDDEDEGISAAQVQQVLEADELAPSWTPLDTPEPRRRVGVWVAGSVLALVVLAAQSVHHYRGELVTSSAVGPLVQSTYALFGTTVAPRWDIRQYEILDWIATAEPNTRGRGSLRITARIKNRGPLYQPYPSLQLRLKDRWEQAVGSRVFAPTEYLAAAPRKLMAPGETTRAEIEVVDPGQDAYGFELDVCVEVETHALSCGSDKVFL